MIEDAIDTGAAEQIIELAVAALFAEIWPALSASYSAEAVRDEIRRAVRAQLECRAIRPN